MTFGSPVDTLAALPMGIPANFAAPVANFMADHVFSRLDIPSWMARTGFQMLDPLKTAKARVDFVRQLHDREALLPARTAAQIPRARRVDRLVRPGDLRAAQAIHRPQPDDDRRFRRQRADGHAHRHHLPGAGVRRRGRRHRPAGVGARHPAGGAQRRGLRKPGSGQGISAWSSDPKRQQQSWPTVAEWVEWLSTGGDKPAGIDLMADQPEEHTDSGVALELPARARHR